MSGLNEGEVGQPLRVNVGENISGATSVIIIAEPEIGRRKEFVATVPNVPVNHNGETLNANEYAEYITSSEDDLDYVGRWRMRLKATYSPQNIQKTDFVKFRVLA